MIITRRKALFTGAASGAVILGAGEANAQCTPTLPFTSFAYKVPGGTTNRTTPTRAADVINVLDYGAVGGNSSFNDGTGIQAAINAAFGPPGSPNGTNSTANKAVFIPNGKYYVNAPLVLTNVLGGYIFGAGMGATSIVGFNNSTSFNTVFKTDGCSHCLFENMELDVSGGISSTGVPCFDLDWVSGTGTIGLHDNLFQNVSFTGGDYGCRIGFTGNDGKRNGFVHCEFLSTNIAGLSAYGANALGNWVMGGGAAQNLGAGYHSKNGQISLITNVGTTSNYPDFLMDSAFSFLIKGTRCESAIMARSNSASSTVKLEGCEMSAIGNSPAITTGTFNNAGTIVLTPVPAGGLTNFNLWVPNGENVVIANASGTGSFAAMNGTWPVASTTTTTVTLTGPAGNGTGTLTSPTTTATFKSQVCWANGPVILDSFALGGSALGSIVFCSNSAFTGTAYIRGGYLAENPPYATFMGGWAGTTAQAI